MRILRVSQQHLCAESVTPTKLHLCAWSWRVLTTVFLRCSLNGTESRGRDGS